MENRIVFLDSGTLGIEELDLSVLKQLGNLEFFKSTSDVELESRVKRAKILVTNKVKINKAALRYADQLQFISMAATGFDNVDVVACKEKGIIVSNVSDYSSYSVAQLVVAYILHAVNTVSIYAEQVHDKVWSNQSRFSYWNNPICDLSSLAIGIIGYGNIAKKVIQFLTPFEIKCYVYNRSEIENPPFNVIQVDLDELCRRSDFVSLHIPANDETVEMVDFSFLKKMKRTSYLINTARGALVHENDLKIALKEKIIAGAYLDVLSQEPPPSSHPLLGVERCIITPHVAWASIQSRQKLIDGIASNIKHFLSGNPINQVN